MSDNCVDNNLSDDDDDIFIGPLTRKEILRHILPSERRQTVSCIKACSEDNINSSFKIIETHSAPDILCTGKLNPPMIKEITNPTVAPDEVICGHEAGDSSFLRLDKMVEDLCVSSDNMPDLDNTLEVVDFILRNGDNKIKSKEANNNIDSDILKSDNMEGKDFDMMPQECQLLSGTNTKSIFKTPLKETISLLNVPVDSKTPIFKTPENPRLHKRMAVTPTTKRPFQHVVSPVASYIKNGPLVPLLKNVRPLKPIAGSSSIPKPVKTLSLINNKENKNLPQIAYRTAKETKLDVLPNDQNHKLPPSQWAHRVASCIPKALVIKHNYRETNSAKKHLPQESSFADLTMNQADLSICTQKSAFNKP